MLFSDKVAILRKTSFKRDTLLPSRVLILGVRFLPQGLLQQLHVQFVVRCGYIVLEWSVHFYDAVHGDDKLLDQLLLNVFLLHVAHILRQKHLEAISDSLPNRFAFSRLTEINH